MAIAGSRSVSSHVHLKIRVLSQHESSVSAVNTQDEMQFIWRRFCKRSHIVKIFLAITLVFGLAQHGAYAFCFSDAASKYQINEMLLRAIAMHESRMKPWLVLENSNGSYDLGLMGINTVHLAPGEKLARAGFTRENLLDPCNSIMAGAYLMALKMQKLGNTWTAIGAYHSTTDEYSQAYQSKIWSSYQRIMRDAGLQP